MSTRKITLLAVYTTIALTIFMIESAIPPLVPIPGVKLGLANIVTLFVIKRHGIRDAALVLFMRVVIASIFAGQIVSFTYSIAGGVLCLLVMGLINYILRGEFLFVTSVFGAIAHNIGQILAAFFVLKMSGIFAYIPFLIISGIITGLFTGLAVFFAEKKIPKLTL